MNPSCTQPSNACCLQCHALTPDAQTSSHGGACLTAVATTLSGEPRLPASTKTCLHICK